ncbi:hypothetical protein COOONC_19661, partial [Cooperia oncophora]
MVLVTKPLFLAFSRQYIALARFADVVWSRHHFLVSEKSSDIHGDFVWIEPLAGEGIPVGARVLDQDHGRLRVVDDLGQ